MQDIPVLDELAVRVESKDVDAGPGAVARPLLVTMQDDEIALGDRTLDVDSLAGIFPRHSKEIVDELRAFRVLRSD